MESVLRQCAGVRQAAVIAREFTVDGDAAVQEIRLIAHIEAPGRCSRRRHVACLHERGLPHYMVPAYFHFLQGLPLNLSGKVDYGALAAVDFNVRQGAGPIRKRRKTPSKKRLAKFLRALLELKRVSRHDNFSISGGALIACGSGRGASSCSFAGEFGSAGIFAGAHRVAALAGRGSRPRKILTTGAKRSRPDDREEDRVINAAALFQSFAVWMYASQSTVSDCGSTHRAARSARALSARIVKHIKTLIKFLRRAKAPLKPIRRSSPMSPMTNRRLLSFAQERLWFLEQLSPAGRVYNLSRALRIDGPLQVDALEASFNRILGRHEALRTKFVEGGGRPFQAIAQPSTHCASSRSICAALSGSRARS